MVTMKQIDAARARIFDGDMNTGALVDLRAAASCVIPAQHTEERRRLAAARAEVETLLREWWAQGCREVEVRCNCWMTNGTSCAKCRPEEVARWRDIAHTNKAHLEDAIIRADRAEAKCDEIAGRNIQLRDQINDLAERNVKLEAKVKDLQTTVRTLRRLDEEQGG